MNGMSDRVHVQKVPILLNLSSTAFLKNCLKKPQH
jgi:hypothetical protein